MAFNFDDNQCDSFIDATAWDDPPDSARRLVMRQAARESLAKVQILLTVAEKLKLQLYEVTAADVIWVRDKMPPRNHPEWLWKLTLTTLIKFRLKQIANNLP